MGRVNCPICEEWRHIDDSEGREDRCWACGWKIPVNKEIGEYRERSEWPPIGDQERQERRRHAEKMLR